MINQFKRYILVIPFLFLVILPIGCDNDDIVLTPETNNVLEETQKITTINYEEIQRDKLFQDLIIKRGLSSYFDISSESSGSKNNNELGFIIKSTEAVKIIKNNYTSYTLSVRRKKESLYDIDNLVIGQKDGETKTRLYTYHFTQENFQTYMSSASLTEDLKYTLVEFSSEGTILSSSEGTIPTTKNKDISIKSSGCSTISVSTPRYCSCVGHSPWDSCDCTPRSGWDTTTIRVCNDSNNGDGPLTTGYTYDNQDISAGGGSAAPSSNPFDPGNDSTITTIFATAEELTLNNLHQRVHFSSPQFDWFLEENNINFAPILASFNFTNNWSQESKDSTKEIVDDLIDSDVDTVKPPSCESFTFTRPTVASPFQNAYVSGIRILALTNSNSQPVFLFYPEPMEFNAPLVDRFGNVYTNGALAEASALALKEAMDQTWERYKNDPNANETNARIFFEDKLKETYPDYIPGGRVTIRPNTILGPIGIYKTNFLGTGNCD